MAAVGSAVGLGNIWRFPFIAGENGGGAFVLVYLICIAAVGLPVLIAELSIGRRGGLSTIGSTREVAIQEGRSRGWQIIGWMAIAAPILGLLFYSTVAGWAFAYIFETAAGVFRGISPEGSGKVLAALHADPLQMAGWHFLFMAATVVIVAKGIRGGLEKAINWMMPLLFLLLLILVAYAAWAGDFRRGVAFLFNPDFARLTPQAILIAMGQAFFTLSLGGGGMMTYGAYLPKGVSLPRTGVVIVAADTLVAILAGLAIFPLVFAYGLTPAGGPGLIFVTLPIAFGQMPLGTLFGTLFFILLAVAALTSSISMLEPVVSYLEEHKGFKRARMALISGLVIWVAGLGSVLSFNIWAEFYPLSFFPLFAKARVFDILNYVTANIFMTLGSLLVAVFVGWLMSRATSVAEFGMGDGPAYRLWRFLIRYVGPLAVGIIFIFGITSL